MHVLIPFAHVDADPFAQATASLELPQLSRLFRQWTLIHQDRGEPDSYSPPHERARAAALAEPGAGPATPWPDGQLPWAAWNGGVPPVPAVPAGHSCAWLSLCHWQVGSGVVRLSDPETLSISQHESDTLYALMAPMFAEDGLELHPHSAQHWRVSGQALAGLRTASLDRVIGRSIDAWLPQGTTAPLARRLQNEMQMLLYTHPLNDARQAQGLPAINSVWFHGSGAAPAGWLLPEAASASAPLAEHPDLRAPALNGDAAAWTQAWQALDAGAIATLMRSDPLTARLTLCGESHAHTWAPRPRSWPARWRGLWRTPLLATTLGALSSTSNPTPRSSTTP